MSRLAFRSPDPEPSKVDATVATQKHNILLEVTIKPMGQNDFNKERAAEQALALKKVREEGRDLFDMNETRKVTSGNKTLYQTTETYGTSVSIEKMKQNIDKDGLTLRVNFHRPGIHSSTTCMELSSDILQRLIDTSANTNGYKIAELRVKQEKTANDPRHGSLFVAIVNRGTQHYLSHIDYKIITSYDAMYHESK